MLQLGEDMSQCSQLRTSLTLQPFTFSNLSALLPYAREIGTGRTSADLESLSSKKGGIHAYTCRFDTYLRLILAKCCDFEQDRQSFSARLKLARLCVNFDFGRIYASIK
jgi:hypothetical protein